MRPLGEQRISYLIIGNGIAGVTAAEILRAEDPQASIGVIADDPCPVYYRPALKDYLGGHIPQEKLWARPANFYRDANVAFLPDRVVGLDSEYHAVLLQSQKKVGYHKLLLANGASPARLTCPGNDLSGVTTLRTVTDYQNVLERLDGRTGTEPAPTAPASDPVRRVVVCGSGTLALETVESLRQRGLEVTHLLRRTTLWSEVLDTTASDLVLQEERRAGVEVRLEEEIVKITGRRGEVSGVMTSRDRRISCQMVLVAIGIEPNIKPWKINGVACGRGVQVDNALRTNLPDVYAAGDLIEIHDRVTNRTRVLGQWYPAVQQARIAASSMLGRSEDVEPFRADPRLLSTYNATFLYGLDFASAGLTITPDQSGYQEVVADPQPRSYRKVILKEGIPVGFLTLGDRKQARALKRAMDYEVNLLPVAGSLFAADFNLSAWLDEQDVGTGPDRGRGNTDRGRRDSGSPLSVSPRPLSYPPEGISRSPISPVPLPIGQAQQGQSLQAAGQAQGQSLHQGEKIQRLTISGEQIGGEEIMVDSRQIQGRVRQAQGSVGRAQGGGGQVQGSGGRTQDGGGQAQGSVPTDMGYEALLVHVVDPALRLQVAETSLSQVGGGSGPAGESGPAQPLRIGRQAGVHLLLDEGSVSRQHAEISYTSGYYVLCDLGSTNGTFLNEQRLDASRPYVLQPNDVIRIGNIVRLKFLLRALAYPSRTQSASFLDDRRDSGLPLSVSALHLPDAPPRPPDTALRQPDAPPGPSDATLRVPSVGKARTGMLAEEAVGAGDRVGARSDPYGADLTYQEQGTPAQVVLNPDGTLSAPGDARPFPASIVEQLKKAPALVIIPERSAQNGTPPQIHFLNPGKWTTIGREEDNDIILTDLTVSRHHAEVLLDVNNGNNFCYIRDLESTYGTLVNQTKVLAPHLLSHSDRIKLGSTRIFFIDLQEGKDLTTKSIGVRRGTRITRKDTGQQTNVTMCPNCGVANARVARFCASCSTGL